MRKFERLLKQTLGNAYFQLVQVLCIIFILVMLAAPPSYSSLSVSFSNVASYLHVDAASRANEFSRFSLATKH